LCPAKLTLDGIVVGDFVLAFQFASSIRFGRIYVASSGPQKRSAAKSRQQCQNYQILGHNQAITSKFMLPKRTPTRKGN